MRWDTLLDKRAGKQSGSIDPDERLLAQTLSVRLLKRCGNIDPGILHDVDTLARWLYVDTFSDRPFDSTAQSARRLCEQWWKRAPARSGAVDIPLVQFCQRLADLLKLSDTERDILVFTWLKLRHPPLNSLHDSLAINDYAQHINLVAELIDRPSGEVARAMQPDSNLIGFDFLARPQRTFHRCEALIAGNMLYRLAPLLLDDPTGSHTDDALREVLLRLCPRQPAGVWPLADFPQVSQRQLLVDYLRRALAEGRSGANVLIHGPPGVGKTELSRTLASVLGAGLYAVPFEDGYQHPIEPKERLGRYRVAQNLIAGKPRSLVLFDEMEDALAGRNFLPKAWTNRLLEENPVPGIWISNRTNWLDPAFLRRFDLIVELQGNKVAARHVLEKNLQPLPVLPGVSESLAEQPWMTPALASQLCDLSDLLPANAPVRNQQHLRGVLSQRLSVLGHKDTALDEIFSPHATGQGACAMPDYGLEWLNTDPGLGQLLSRLKQRGRGRLCLYGPPGTGKTALAQHLADSLGRPLITASAPSLLDCYVGGTEKSIAELFERASDQKAVLLVDEIDSLLRSRAAASQSWEVSHTNELLVQLEGFNGVFLATTNQVDSLDRAVMRRFDLKVAFHYLNETQLRQLLREVLPVREKEKLDVLPDAELSNRCLTPGNMRTALDQLDLRGQPLQLKTLLKALELEEQEQSGDRNRQPMRFV